jgi:hypothetical protein
MLASRWHPLCPALPAPLQGKVFALSFSPDTPLTLAAAGSAAKLQVWDLAANAGVRKAFGPRLRQAGREFRERKEGQANGGIIGIADDEEDSDDEGPAGGGMDMDWARCLIDANQLSRQLSCDEIAARRQRPHMQRGGEHQRYTS